MQASLDEGEHRDSLDGRRPKLRRPWGDGTTYLEFDPVMFLERLAVLVPRPRVNLILYHGVLAPRAAWRAAVVPGPNGPDGVEAASGTGGSQWPALMRRAFGFDVTACTRCGGRLRLIALIEHTSIIRRILTHLGLPSEIGRAHV